MKPSANARPIGFAAIGAFLFFGALMASYAAITLLYPGTILDQGWKLNPNAHLELSAVGRIMALPFIILAPVLALAGVGWFRRSFWGWLLGFADCHQPGEAMCSTSSPEKSSKVWWEFWSQGCC
jgi:hypothetical protein